MRPWLGLLNMYATAFSIRKKFMQLKGLITIINLLSHLTLKI